MPRLSQRTALGLALRLLADLRESTPCQLDGHAFCTEHHWASPEPCPQARIKHLIQHLDEQGGSPVPPYTQLSLLALLRGCTDKQEVHVAVAVNGYTHRGKLGHDDSDPALRGRFTVDLLHGERITSVSADDILEAEVSARSLLGVPNDPTHDPK